MKKLCLESVADNTDEIYQQYFSFKQSFLACEHRHNSICSESSRKFWSLRSWCETVSHSLPMLKTRAYVRHSLGLAQQSAQGKDHIQNGSTLLKMRIFVLAFLLFDTAMESLPRARLQQPLHVLQTTEFSDGGFVFQGPGMLIHCTFQSGMCSGNKWNSTWIVSFNLHLSSQG